MKQVSKVISSVTAALLLAATFTACPSDVPDADPENISETEETVEPASVSFNISNAIALGTAGADSSRHARTTTTPEALSSDTSSLVKILADGTSSAAMQSQGNIEKANIKSIVKSPVTDDVYIWYDTATYDKSSGGAGYLLSPLVCVHSDNTYTNLLFQATQFSQDGYLVLDYKTDIAFDDYGNAYIFAREPGGWERYIYKYDPRTNQRTTLKSVIYQYETNDYQDKDNYSKFMVSKDGSYLYASKSRGGKEYLEVIPTADPDNSVELIGGSYFSWTYNRNDDKLYVSTYDDTSSLPNGRGTYSAPKDIRDNSGFVQKSSSLYSTLLPSSKGVWGCNATESNNIILVNINDTTQTYSCTTARGLSLSNETDNGTEINGYLYLRGYGWLPESECPEYNTNPGLYNNDYGLYVKTAFISELYRFNLNTHEFENVLGNSPYKMQSHIESWSANSSALYYSGYFKNKLINGKVDLNTLSHSELSSSQLISNLAAM